ncbi:hypothetical protein THTE_1804 [Thermogutta terrifontis]|uniref:Uncharacterized protein n=1 Tax=Thermogutta terrifontis TaxID=1331910 RepID=A0A286REM1_9BACT|nr:hypothetical protein THTE_1804 [Thermogutta terrifontis]
MPPQHKALPRSACLPSGKGKLATSQGLARLRPKNKMASN